METRFEPGEIIARLRADRDSAESVAEKSRTRSAAFVSAWRQASGPEVPMGVARLAPLAEMLRRESAEFWLDFLAVDAMRRGKLFEKGFLPEDVHLCYTIISLRLIRSALESGHAGFDSELSRVDEPDRGAVAEVTGLMICNVKLWHIDGHVPYTPFMRQIEISDACGGAARLKGFSKSDVSKKVSSGEIERIANSGALKGCGYHRFRHADPEFQREMIRLTVDYLKNTKEFGFFFPGAKI